LRCASQATATGSCSIKDALIALGVTIKDAKDPKTGKFTTTWEVAR